ncbi:RNA polymerase subunit sigma-24 [Anaerosporomusa subterranea]|uniref:RNA polymerase sigma factor n=2 Tax=Anaerosporomusa subterranea TaxID=1794912 RepID=A0A154BRG0_ANASB|nr:RNA polymerase subunit sigma-24 [Anaerosporomusa subterranea]
MTTLGSSVTFSRLYDENYPKVYHLALALAGNASDAEEITQEAFLRAFRAFSSFRNDSAFFTWIYRIALNVARDYLKYRDKLPIQTVTEDLGYCLDDIIDTNPASDPEAEVLANEARFRCLHYFTECLTPSQRIVFSLAVSLTLPQKLIAEILGCSLPAVKITLYRAKKRIAAFLSGRCKLINEANPCRCDQWVRFGRAQGWLTAEHPASSRPLIVIQAVADIGKIQTLSAIYQQLYPENADEALAKRIKQALEKKEWTIFS